MSETKIRPKLWKLRYPLEIISKMYSNCPPS